MDYKDYYKILGVDKKATEKEIKSAYRKLARQYHPDVNSAADAEERFKEINEAYEVLSDSEKRSKYEQLGADWKRWQQGGGNPGNFDWSQWQTTPDGQRVYVNYSGGGGVGDIFGGNGFFDDSSPFSDFFKSIFGSMGGASAQGVGYTSSSQRGQDIEHNIEISLAEAYLGTSRAISKDGRRLEVKIPAGVKSGSRVRVQGGGAQSTSGGQSGDLYLRLKVAPDPRFARQGDDLQASVPIDLYTAVLGGEVSVPTLSGTAKLKIPNGTQNGQKFRLRGKGMPKIRHKGQYGDLFVRVEVQLPAKLNTKQRKLFEQLRDLS